MEAGSYDHTVKLFDTRTSGSVLTVEHGQPVESVLMYPTGGLFLSAGGTVIKVWDALAGGRLLASFSNHHKTITSLCFCSDYQRLMSASLDRHVKIYDVSTYQVVHTLDYPSAVLSVGAAPNDSVVVAGMADGLLSIQHRKNEEQAQKERQEKRRSKKASYKYVLTGKTYLPAKDDLIVPHQRKVQLAKYDKYFQKFAYTKALDAAMMDIRVRMKTPEVTVSVLQELIRRGGIKAALAGRDEKSLSIIIKFIQKNLGNNNFTSTLLDVANITLDIYAEQLGQLHTVGELLLRLKHTVDQEVNYMKLLLEVMGTMDTIFAASQQTELPGQQNGVVPEKTIVPSSTAVSDTS